MAYDLGTRLGSAHAREAAFGEEAFDLVAKSTAMPGGEKQLMGLMDFAQAFDRDFVKDEVQIPLDNGRWLEAGPFVALCRLRLPKERLEMMERVRAESLSVRKPESLVKRRRPRSPSTAGKGSGHNLKSGF